MLENWKHEHKEHENNGYTNCRWSSLNCHQSFCQRRRGLGYKRSSGDHPNYSIVEIDKNTEKNPGDLRWIVVTQTPVNDHWLTLMWEAFKSKIIIIIIIIIILMIIMFLSIIGFHPSCSAQRIINSLHQYSGEKIGSMFIQCFIRFTKGMRYKKIINWIRAKKMLRRDLLKK